VTALPPGELGELEAFVDLFEAAPAGLGARVERICGAVCLALPATPRSAMFNRVLGLGLERPATPGDVEEIAAFFRELGVEWCAAVAPRAEPADLRSLLGEAGLQPGYGWAKFRRGTGEVSSASTSELLVERVDGREGMAFAETFGRGYGVPELMHDWLALLPGREGWHCFLARDGDAPAAAGAVFVGSRVGWLGIAATLPEYRRRGAQSALLAARIRAAAEARCEVVVTETGELVDGKPSNSYRNILRAGFELDYVRANYLSSPAADTSGTE
jgi:GNAT superfamily N-acetyltransferase